MSVDFIAGVIKFNAQTAGRDKICRLCQYASKFLWWQLLQRSKSDELIQKLKNLEYSISTTRKLLRFGKSFDYLYGALKSMHIQDAVLRITITLSRINQALYLFFDHLLWIDRVGLYEVDKKRWGELSARFWLGTLVLNLTRNSYDIWQIVLGEYKRYSSQSRKHDLDDVNQNKTISFEKVLVKSLLENRPVMLDFIKNATDIFLPLSTLGKVNVSPGFQGIMGIVSSAIGIMTVWDPVLKLVP